ncbi:MAG TPA: tyrosine-type recombinase/integrase [Skermanella sp.]|nr:tyrosine-type recombinase/integrase [Skermanella sp.]
MPRVRETEYIDVIRLEQDDGSVHEAVIFLRDPVWYTRITYDSGKTYHRISTKKRDPDAARKVALAQFYEGRGIARLGLKITKATIASLAEDMLKEKERRVAATNRGAYVLRTYRAKVPRLNEFFGKLQAQQVTSKLWDEYVLLRLTTGKPKLAEIHRHGLPRKISRGTLEQERDVLRAILRLAVERKLISALPTMELPRLGARKKMVSRASFSDSEIEVMVNRINRQINDARNEEIAWNNRMLLCYVMILLTTGLRTNDIKLLRWRDVSELTRTDGRIVLRLACRGKGMEREAVSQPEATDWVHELRRIARAVCPDDLLFTGPSGKAYNFTVAFRKLLVATKLRTDANGRARSAYSLRHSFAMARIMEPSLNLTDLAENMGTSVEMMATHYLSHINVISRVDTITATIRPSQHAYLMKPETHRHAGQAAQEVKRAVKLPKGR